MIMEIEGKGGTVEPKVGGGVCEGAFLIRMSRRENQSFEQQVDSNTDPDGWSVAEQGQMGQDI